MNTNYQLKELHSSNPAREHVAAERLQSGSDTLLCSAAIPGDSVKEF
jgi:hypothetical protein